MDNRVPNLAALGIRIANARHALGWSIDRLADESSVGRRTVMNVEAARKVPRLDTLFALSCALGVPIQEFVEVL